MFKSLQQLLNSSSDDAEHPNVQLAAAALMLEMVRVDGDSATVELETMANICQQQFSLSESEYQELLNAVRQSADQATDLHAFTRQICEHYSNAERFALLENLWLLAFADAKVDAHERHLLRKVAGLLYLTPSQIIQAYENAKQHSGKQ